MADNSKPASEAEKNRIRNNNRKLHDEAIDLIKYIYDVNKPPYMAEGAFCKDYRKWEIGDLARIDKGTLAVLHTMAETDDYAHLKQIMPDRYKGELNDLEGPGGGVERFAHHIEATYYHHDNGWYATPEGQEYERARGKKVNGVKGTGALIDIEDLSPDIGLSPTENPALDPSQVMKSRGLVMADAANGQKKPLETAVADAISSIKNTIVRS